MDHLGLVTGLQVVKDGGVVKEGEVDHVLAHLELRRVDLAHERGLVGELLVADRHRHLGGWVLEVTCLQYSFAITSILRVRTPHRLLWVLEDMKIEPFERPIHP